MYDRTSLNFSEKIEKENYFSSIIVTPCGKFKNSDDALVDLASNLDEYSKK